MTGWIYRYDFGIVIDLLNIHALFDVFQHARIIKRFIYGNRTCVLRAKDWIKYNKRGRETSEKTFYAHCAFLRLCHKRLPFARHPWALDYLRFLFFFLLLKLFLFLHSGLTSSLRICKCRTACNSDESYCSTLVVCPVRALPFGLTRSCPTAPD